MLEGYFDSSMHIAFGTVGRAGCARPVGFEEWAGDVSNLQIVFGEDAPGLGGLVVAQVHGVLAPHGTKFDPAKPEIVRDDRTDVFEVLGDFVVDDGNSEGGAGRLGTAEVGT